MSEKFESSYTNQYGEEWIFEYDTTTGIGIVKGSDVDWAEYQVVEGVAPLLILSDGEKQWLRSAWEEAIGRQSAARMVGNGDI